MTSVQGWAESGNFRDDDNTWGRRNYSERTRRPRKKTGIERWINKRFKGLRNFITGGGDVPNAPEANPASATTVPNVPVYIEIDKNPNKFPKGQTMKVYKNGKLYKTYEVSTGQNIGSLYTRTKGAHPSCRQTLTSSTHNNPEGELFKVDPNRMVEKWPSRAYSGANMYNTIFFGREKGDPKGYTAECVEGQKCSGTAIHGVDVGLYGDLGKPASGGCVRMRKHESLEVSDLVKENPEGVRIRVIDTSTQEEKDAIAKSCKDDKAILYCVREILSGMYPDLNANFSSANGETPYEQKLRLESEMAATAPGDGHFTHTFSDSDIERAKNGQAEDYPPFVMDKDKYNHDQAKKYFAENKFTYQLTYKQKYEGGKLINSMGFRKFLVPENFMKNLIKECETSKNLTFNSYNREDYRNATPTGPTNLIPPHLRVDNQPQADKPVANRPAINIERRVGRDDDGGGYNIFD